MHNTYIHTYIHTYIKKRNIHTYKKYMHNTYIHTYIKKRNIHNTYLIHTYIHTHAHTHIHMLNLSNKTPHIVGCAVTLYTYHAPPNSTILRNAAITQAVGDLQ